MCVPRRRAGTSPLPFLKRTFAAEKFANQIANQRAGVTGFVAKGTLLALGVGYGRDPFATPLDHIDPLNA
jgi:hypothetical protein